MSSARLFISGLKDPIVITSEQGKAVNGILENITIPEEQRVNIAAGKWVGAKKLIKYVTFDQDEHKHDERKRNFTATEVERFRRELKEHLAGRQQTKRLFWEYYEKRGAIRVEIIMSKVPGIGEIPEMLIRNFELYQYLDDLKDFVSSIDRRNDFEVEQDNSLDDKVEQVAEKMTFKL